MSFFASVLFERNRWRQSIRLIDYSCNYLSDHVGERKGPKEGGLLVQVRVSLKD